MQSKKERCRRFLASHNNVFVLTGMILLFLIFLIFVGKADQREVNSLAGETISFLETVCQRYDSYAYGQTADVLKDIFDKAEGVREFATTEELSDEDYLLRFSKTHRITGILVTDGDANPTAWADVNGTDASRLWQPFLLNENRDNIIQYKKKAYNGKVTVQNKEYNVTIVSRKDTDGLILCYSEVTDVATDIYSTSLENTMTNNTFHKNPEIVISDKNGIVATNIQSLQSGKSEFLGSFNMQGSYDPDEMIVFHLNGKVWYGKCKAFGNYYIYVFYRGSEVYSNTLSLLAVFIAIYAILCMAVLLLRRHSERKHLKEEQQQMNTIRAISRLYVSTSMIHLEQGTIEGIEASARVRHVLEQSTDAKIVANMLADQVIAPEHREAYRAFLDLATMEERLKQKADVSLVFQDVEGVWFSGYLVPVAYGKDGKLQDVLFVSRNIDDYMQTEERYKEQLRKTAMEAEIANAAKTSFLRRMSHDVRTPVNGILGMAALAQKSLEKADGAGTEERIKETSEYIRKMAVSADYLQELMDDILRMSKLESGKVIFEERPFDLLQIIRETTEFMEERARGKQVHLAVDTSALTQAYVIGSPMHFRQVIQNLVSNAIKFNHPGGEVLLEFREQLQENDMVQITFVCKDTGCGMSEEFQKHAFEPFEQERDSARTTYEGTGLGLSVTKQILERRGGTISFVSEKGMGTTFTVMIPFKIDHICKEKHEEDHAESSIAGVKILLVEDNELNLEIARAMLEEEQAVITVAHNGVEAVEIFRQSEAGTFDIILMDIMMPEMDGLEATRTIRQMSHPDAVKIPVFAMTANAFVEDVERSRAAGMNEHLAKPLHIETVIAAIAKYYGGVETEK